MSRVYLTTFPGTARQRRHWILPQFTLWDNIKGEQKRWRGTRLTERRFRKCLVQENLTFIEAFGFKSLATQLPVISHNGLSYMKFTVANLKLLRKMVNCANAKDEVMLTRYLQKKQPGFFSLIQDVAIDPRCAKACRYCTLFCGLVLDQVDVQMNESPSPLSEAEFRSIAGKVARHDKDIGKRAMAYPARISKHVLGTRDFDHEDSGWLCTMIATFLITVERFFNNM